MKYFVLVCMAVLAFFEPAVAQTQSGSTKTPQQQLDALKGTYELKYNSRQMSTLPSNLAEIIEKNRKENETNTVKLNENVVVIIYPKKQVQHHQ